MRIHATLALLLLVTASAMAGGDFEEIVSKVQEAFDQETGTFAEGAYESLLEAHGMIETALSDEEAVTGETKTLITGLDILVAYNLACLEALGGENEAAFEWLTYAVETGYMDPAWMQEDPDLESLRDDERFTPLVEAAAANLEAMGSCGGCPSAGSCGDIEEEHVDYDCESCSE